MCRQDTGSESERRRDQNGPIEDIKEQRWKLSLFMSVLGIDVALSLLFLSSIVPFFPNHEGTTESSHFSVYGSLSDLAILSSLRIISAILTLVRSYFSDDIPEASPFDLYHPNGERKSREELDDEALEEPCCPWFRRYISRRSFLCEFVCLAAGLWSAVKCLARLNQELSMEEKASPHSLFWLALGQSALFSTIIPAYLESIANIASRYGQAVRSDSNNSGWMHRIGSNLSIPLLSSQTTSHHEQQEESNDVEQGADNTGNDDVRGVSDISSDTTYKAEWSDLLKLCLPNIHLIALASIFLFLAALAQVYIPKFTGNILDSLAETFAGQDDDGERPPIWQVPGFLANIEKLVVASILCGVFSGIRGSVFTVVGGRVNVRLRLKLMDALLTQDIGFFDVTKTGDITSRLSSDTTLVGDQVMLNVNVFLRSLVQAMGVLAFMFVVSWQLSLLAFISVPVITVLSKWYGNFVRSLTKLMQKKLADGNSVSEAAIGSMATVRAFDAGEGELNEFTQCMEKYLSLNRRSAIAYFGYCTCVTALPQLVTALVLFYGGLLVRNGDMTSGQLVSFLLYLQSLSDAFSSLGYIFSSLTQAAGAADKVFELMNRKPRLRQSNTDERGDAIDSLGRDMFRRLPESSQRQGFMGMEITKTSRHRRAGASPAACQGKVTLKDVELYYPARHQRAVLSKLNLTANPGQVVALVGPSGSGKSSVMALVQHLYEPSSGEVLIDDENVHNLAPQWLSRHVSVVSQEPTLFARSIRRNIMYGLEGTEFEPTDEEIREAARLANAASFIEKLPNGYETDVGERGVQLSGGQKQRVAIARALVRKPRVLLLDEATSALDAESEALVQDAIDDMLADRGYDGNPGMTVLIVAHRLSTVRNADVIYVVEEGRVTEQGSHEELIQNEAGAYSTLISRQMRAQKKLDHVVD